MRILEEPSLQRRGSEEVLIVEVIYGWCIGENEHSIYVSTVRRYCPLLSDMLLWRPFLAALAAITPAVSEASATLRFSCSQLAVDRIDP